MTDPIVELIAKQSMARLDEMEGELEHTIHQATVRLEIVRDAKVLKRESSGSAGRIERALRERRSSNGRGSKVGAIKAIMESEPEHGGWRAPEVSARLKERGIDLSRDGARVAMTRSAEFEKLSDGSFGLVTSNGFHQASVSEAATSETENRETRLLGGAREGPG